MDRRWQFACLLFIAAAFGVPARAQQPAPASAAPVAGAKLKPKPKPKPAPKPAPATPAAAVERHEAPAVHEAGGQPKLLGQYAEWGAYTASPGGKKVCFAISKPMSSETNPPNRPRNPVYMFISTRPADKVTNEVSIIIGYPFKPGSEASAQVGSPSFALYTQQDGAWIKNAAEEAQMVDAMRGGDNAVVKGESAKGTQTTDTFNLKGVSQALDRMAQECK
ncbi:MAG: invasion associated locus B family protein [Xanthobacteraceae bacterium]